jgi:hypothetical protein
LKENLNNTSIRILKDITKGQHVLVSFISSIRIEILQFNFEIWDIYLWFEGCYTGRVEKQCKYCLQYFGELDFGVAKTTAKKVYRRRKCKHCYRETKTALKKRRRKWIEDYKRERGCTKCGIEDPRVLDFHHVRDKEFSISEYYHYHFSLEKVKMEIEKCIVICANCHRVLHWTSKNK